jgi:hypothetical protein
MKTRQLWLFKRLIYQSLKMTFLGFPMAYPSTFGTGNGNEDGGFFIGLVCLITRWMEHICDTHLNLTL